MKGGATTSQWANEVIDGEKNADPDDLNNENIQEQGKGSEEAKFHFLTETLAYNEDQAREALKIKDNNLEEALDYLILSENGFVMLVAAKHKVTTEEAIEKLISTNGNLDEALNIPNN